MFIKLTWGRTKATIVFNASHIVRFGKGSGATWLITSDGREHGDINETPDEILALLAGDQK